MPRIIAGAFGGRRLVVTSDDTRPTSDRVREALFAAIDSRVDLDGMTVLDLFAGTGALGLEALSRGAAAAVFVDSGRSAADGLKANIATCDAADRATVVRADALAYLGGAGNQVFDMVFCDPPYGLPDEELERVLVAVGPLVGDGYLILERGRRARPTVWPPILRPVLQKVYGDTRVEWAERVDAEEPA
ncbi:MAG: 16S rRNA (guanine(966)-N(2))-methyltransferase RsmD [Gordonia sp. (in: high G+C Gram-positive bacteria)]|uniref:16S rRNA (guanine(966)-N(2))-methyltransferase RsmD n=1 Tax=Gordonia sp. (in: high G+C Gram-positive bacteria) TaxID=84139 RepID=UPI0039E6FE05